MNITVTLFAQMAAFILLIVFINKLLWGPLSKMMEDRQKRIADGLSAADRAAKDLELAQEKAAGEIRAAREQGAQIVAMANKRASEIVEEAKAQARVEGDRILAAAKAEVDQEAHRAREQLRKQVAVLAVAGAEKVLSKSIDAKAHSELLDKLAAEL